MKAIFAIALFVSSISFAVIQPYGTFIPSRCGKNQETKMTMCFGSAQGIKGQFVSIEYKNNLDVVYKVTKRKATNGGINPSFRAETLTLVNNQEKLEAEVRWESNRGDKEVVTVYLKNGSTVTFENFNVVLTLM